MKLIVHTTDGMNWKKLVPVETISVWIDHTVNHLPNQSSLNALLKQAKKSGRMHIYYCDGILNGTIDAFESTPLYSNGARAVEALELDGRVIWES